MESGNTRKHDLEERTLLFAKSIRRFCERIQTPFNKSDVQQLIRSSGSIGANYQEAKEALSRKDFVYRLKVCLKESKETLYWLTLLEPKSEDSEYKLALKEINELVSIFGASLRTTKNSDQR